MGSHRLGIMIDKQSNYGKKKYGDIGEIKSKILKDKQKKMIVDAQKYLSKEFYSILNLFKLQYSLLFRELYDSESKQKDVITITHGYDFPVPSPKRRFSFRCPSQPIANVILDNGNWLYTPLMIKGILDKKDQTAIMVAMIYEFNEMMSSFSEEYDNIYHVDSTGLASEETDWFDELHLKCHKFKIVAQAYEKIIRDHKKLVDGRKVIRAIDPI